ncbi:MAG: hypothetical protein U5L09_10940 [Bacteroidales bacterium]|nr:hypothetical protein [Bacteroidales bacterium]
MVNKLMLVLVVLLWGLAAVGQEARRGNDRLSMNIGYTGFFKNNEYPANYAKGYTLTGNHLTPLLSYHVGEMMTLRAGAHLLKYNGRDSFSEVRPFLGFDLWLTPGFRLTIGSYSIPHQHRLSPILFSDERRFTDYVEEGLRMQYKAAGVKAEAWLHWDQFIFQEDPFQEHFTAGFSGQWTAFSSDLLHGTLYGQFLATHQGGR